MRSVLRCLLLLSILATPAAGQVPRAYRVTEPVKNEGVGVLVPPSTPGSPGDSFANPIPIPALPFSASGSTCGFNNNVQGACGGTGPDVVYVFAPTQNMTVTMSLCDPSTNFDTVLNLYRNNSSTLVTCSDDFCGLSSQITSVTLFAGNIYYIVVDGLAGACGNYRLTVEDAGPACNVVFPPDATPEPEPVCVDGSVDRNNAGCNSDPPTWTDVPCSLSPITMSGHYGDFVTGGINLRDTDWYRVVANQPTTLTATLDSEVDGVIAILDLSGGCGNIRTVFPSPDPTLLVPKCTPVTASASVPAGTYFVFVAPAAFTGVPGTARYTITFSGASCTTLTKARTWGSLKALYR